MVVDGALGLGLPAEGDELEDLVAVDQVAGVPAGREMQIALQRSRIEQKAAQARAHFSGLEPGGRHPPERVDDSLDGNLHGRLLLLHHNAHRGVAGIAFQTASGGAACACEA